MNVELGYFSQQAVGFAKQLGLHSGFYRNAEGKSEWRTSRTFTSDYSVSFQLASLSAFHSRIVNKLVDTGIQLFRRFSYKWRQ